MDPETLTLSLETLSNKALSKRTVADKMYVHLVVDAYEQTDIAGNSSANEQSTNRLKKHRKCLFSILSFHGLAHYLGAPSALSDCSR